MVLTTVVMGGTTWFAHRAEYLEKQATLQRELAMAADQAATNLALPVWYLDQRQMVAILDQLMANPVAQDAQVAFHAGTLPGLVRQRPAAPGDVAERDLLVAERPIQLRGQTLGTVRLRFTPRQALAELHSELRHRLSALAAFLFILVAGLALALWRSVLRPLRELRRLAEAVSLDRDLPPATADFRGELAEVRAALARTFDLLKERYASLRRSEERARTMLATATDAIWLLDLQGRVLEVNGAACRMLGYSRDELLGQDIADLDASEDAGTARRHIAKVVEQGADTFETRHRRKDGTTFPAEVSVTYLAEQGCLLSFIRDISERFAMEQERARLQQELTQAQKMESLGRLAGGIAHDMNNVLGAILGLASAQAYRLPEDAPERAACQTMIAACERGGAMVKSLLSFARSRPAEERQLDLNTLLHEEIRLLERTTLARINLVLDLQPSLPAVLGDPAALSNMFMNLCVNAVDAMPDGGSLSLRSRAADGWVEVEVADTGTGMPAEVLAKACDPFFTTKGPGQGTGLGLSTAFSTMQAHGGRLELASELGQGTRVRLRFPACAAAPAPPEAPPATPAASREPQRSLQILVVDDDPLVRQATATLLETLGHQPSCAASGEQALELLSAGLGPDLAILDLNMPGLGGAATLARLRQLEPSLPVLVATGGAEAEARRLAATVPGLTVLPKPYRAEDLQRCLGALARS